MTEEENETKFAKTFNKGYFMHQYEPDLLKGILKPENMNIENIRTMALGKKQYEVDKLSKEMTQDHEGQNFDISVE